MKIIKRDSVSTQDSQHTRQSSRLSSKTYYIEKGCKKGCNLRCDIRDIRCFIRMKYGMVKAVIVWFVFPQVRLSSGGYNNLRFEFPYSVSMTQRIKIDGNLCILLSDVLGFRGNFFRISRRVSDRYITIWPWTGFQPVAVLRIGNWRDYSNRKWSVFLNNTTQSAKQEAKPRSPDRESKTLSARPWNFNKKIVNDRRKTALTGQKIKNPLFLKK